MPKIIENLESRLLEEAKKQMEALGYDALTMRSIAKACGIGVGTVYNYFPSKDRLIATYMLHDWKEAVTSIENVSTFTDDPSNVIHCIYDQLRYFAQRHQKLFSNNAAAASFAGSLSRYHAMLRSQLAAPIRKFCDSDFSAEFIAESLLVWTMAEKEFDEIYAVIRKLF